MIEALETLAALAEWGTMTRAATHLRLTQSAVSKRIRALEERTGSTLIEPVGRGVVLTSAGARLLERAEPALAALRDALVPDEDTGRQQLEIGVSESILASWGAPLFARAQREFADVDVTLHAHRSPVVTERVLAGEFAIGLVAGSRERAAGLVVDDLPAEPLVLVARERVRTRRGASPGVVSIEPDSATGRALARRLPGFRSQSGIDLRVDSVLQSYAAIVAVARSGLGPGLVPEGLARAMGVPASAITRLPRPGLERPVCLLTRRAALRRSAVARLREFLREAAGPALDPALRRKRS